MNRPSDATGRMDRLTPLETTVLAALADELSAQIPDLAGQILEALPGARRLTAEGFRAEIIVDRRRPSPPSGPTGWLGRVHGDVAPLEHPMAFQAEFLNGRLMALAGSTYDEDATAIDLRAARVTGLFTVTVTGRSVAWEPRRIRPQDSPLQALHHRDDDTDLPRERPPPIPPEVRALGGMIFGGHNKYRPAPPPPPTLPALASDEQKSWVIGVWVLAIVAGVFTLLLGLSWIVALGVTGYVGALLQRRTVQERLRRVWAAMRAHDP